MFFGKYMFYIITATNILKDRKQEHVKLRARSATTDIQFATSQRTPEARV
jgi:hypothetical protein